MSKSWIKFYRKVWNWPYANRPNYLSVWCWLLTHAEYKETNADFGGKLITLKPGQLITGKKEISEATGVPLTSVERILKTLKNGQQIGHQTCNKGRLITITYWDEYQNPDYDSDIKRTSNGHQTDTTNNIKNKNKDNKKQKEPVISFDQILVSIGVDKTLWDDFLDVRKRLKAVNSQRALNGIKNKLIKFYQSGLQPNEIIERSVINSWKDVYEPRDSNYSSSTDRKLSTVEKHSRDGRAWIAENCPDILNDSEPKEVRGTATFASKGNGKVVGQIFPDSWR